MNIFQNKPNRTLWIILAIAIALIILVILVFENRLEQIDRDLGEKGTSLISP